jgi:tRNA (adenine37-N6)-methyltransferase
MTLSRRDVLSGALPLAAAGGLSVPLEGGSEEEAVVFEMYPVGRVEKKNDVVRLRIFEAYTDALLGVEQWSHINVLYWFDKNDTPQKREILRVHPRGKKENPLTGVFACRAPVRPNLIALTVCKVLSVEEGVITVDSIDAFDETPILDIKPLTGGDVPREDLRIPAWVGKKK